MRSGCRWVPCAGNYVVWPDVLPVERPDFILMTVPEPDCGDSGITVNVPELVATGDVREIGRYRAYGSDDTCTRWWCIFSYVGHGEEIPELDKARSAILKRRRQKWIHDVPDFKPRT